MKIVTVIPFKKGMLKEEFTYFSADKNIEEGSIVNMPIRNTKHLGLVISSLDASTQKSEIKGMSFNLKKITEVKEKSIFSKELFESLILVSKYFAIKKSEAIASLIPSVIIEEYDKISKINLKEKEIKSDFVKLKAEKLLFQASIENRIDFYKTYIRTSFAEKKSIFIVLPTEKDINDFYLYLSKGVENFTFILHGGLTKKKQLEKIQDILKCEHPILMLCTAPFLSIDREDVSTIIVEHESSIGYKTIKRPNIDLRIFSEIFASKINAKFIFADSFLRYETIARKELDNFSLLHPLSFRTNYEGDILIPEIEEKWKVLNTQSIKEIKDTLEKKEKVFIFSLRKGLATMTLCHDCSQIVLCPLCSAPIVLYMSRDKKKRMFVCNKCKHKMDPQTKCTSCDSWNLVPLGIGTDTVYEEIKKQFPKTKIFQIDKENTTTLKAIEKTISEFENTENSILIGTEMAIPHIKEKVALSLIASFDSLWSIPNFKMGEKIIQILISITSKTKDKFIIQTKNKDDRAILAFKNESLVSFVREEIQDRKDLEYPPFKRFIKITHTGNKEGTLKTKESLNYIFKEYNPLIFSGFLSKQKDQYMTNTLIKINTKEWSLSELSSNSKIDEVLSNKLNSLPYDFIINIDPEDLL